MDFSLWTGKEFNNKEVWAMCSLNKPGLADSGASWNEVFPSLHETDMWRFRMQWKELFKDLMVRCRNLGCCACNMAWSWKVTNRRIKVLSFRTDLGLFRMCLEGCCKIWSCREEEETGELDGFPKPCAPISRMICSLCRKPGKDLSRPTGVSWDPDKENIQLVLVPHKYRHTVLV